MKPRIKSMIWNIKKQKTIHQTNKKKEESKKTKERVSSLRDKFMQSNIHIIGKTEEKELSCLPSRDRGTG